ncbi:MAG: formylglycine-generating enzyme family protein [Victivallaceae bacterium]
MSSKIKSVLIAVTALSVLQLAGADVIPEITTSTGAKMVLIPGGTFVMGSKTGLADEKDVHQVKVSSFYMDVNEVTQESYQQVTGMNPSKFRDRKGPVERVRWTDAALYCNARSIKEGLQPCYNPATWKCDFSKNGYRLPTEAEWEYACRANSSSDYYFDGEAAQLGRYGWFRNNSDEKVHPAGKKKPNAFGLYDMYGNVNEWCNDFYAADYYLKSLTDNPRGPAAGSKRVLRGGSWSDRAKNCRSARRFSDAPTTADICQGYDTYGFRCVRNANQETVK